MTTRMEIKKEMEQFWKSGIELQPSETVEQFVM